MVPLGGVFVFRLSPAISLHKYNALPHALPHALQHALSHLLPVMNCQIIGEVPHGRARWLSAGGGQPSRGEHKGRRFLGCGDHEGDAALRDGAM